MSNCIVHSTDFNYKLKELYNQLKESYATVRLFRDVIYLNYNNGHVYIFPFGTAVFWLLSEQDYHAVLDIITGYLTKPIDKGYSEQYNVEFDDKIQLAENTIYLKSEDVMDMLTISHGLAQSEKLGVFEHKIHDLITEIEPLYQDLGVHGKISLSRKNISKKIGQLFSARSFVNLHMSILDTPDFFWEREELEPIYQKTIHYLELKSRMHALNARMSIIQELYDVLHNELQTKHSHTLEWIIILLILIEVIMSLMR